MSKSGEKEELTNERAEFAVKYANLSEAFSELKVHIEKMEKLDEEVKEAATKARLIYWPCWWHCWWYRRWPCLWPVRRIRET